MTAPPQSVDPSSLALDLLPCGVVVGDAQGRAVVWNNAARVLLGLGGPDGDAVALTCEGRRVPLCELLRDHAVGQVVRRRLALEHPELGWLHATLTRVAEAGVEPHVHLAVERRPGQDWRLAGRSDPLAAFAHELRNALTSLREGLALLAEGAAGELSQLQQRLLGGVREDAERMARLSDEMVAANRVRASRVRVFARSVDAGALVYGAVQAFGSAAVEGGVDLAAGTVEEQVWCHADRDLLTQALGNLVSNAVKFTPQGGRVRVSSRRVAGDSDEQFVEWSVRDTGPGLAAEPSDGNPPRDAQRRGLGIGLAIAREVAEQHGGSLCAESRPGGGSCFRLTVPSDFRRSRRWLVAQVADELKLARALGAPLALVAIEVRATDGRGGLWACERGLVQLPLIEQCVEESLRPSDSVLVNNDSATLVLHDVDRPSARRVAERARAGLSRLLAALPEPCPRCELAVGVASYPADGQTAEAVLAMARRELRHGSSAAASQGTEHPHDDTAAGEPLDTTCLAREAALGEEKPGG